MTQRTFEYISIEAKSNEDAVGNATRYTLLVSNSLELLMELALYFALIRVSCIMRNFLKSFGDLSRESVEYDMINQGRLVFKIMIINLIVMMVTNSVFCALSPYLWLGDVFATKGVTIKLYSITTTFFYIANTFFACLMLYVIFYFGIDAENTQ